MVKLKNIVKITEAGTMKLTKEEKIKYVRAYNAGEIINTPEGFRNRRSFKSSLLNWVKRYNAKGENGLERRQRKTVNKHMPLKTAIGSYAY